MTGIGTEAHQHVAEELCNSETVMIGSSIVGGVSKALGVQLEEEFAWRKYSGAKTEDIMRRLRDRILIV